MRRGELVLALLCALVPLTVRGHAPGELIAGQPNHVHDASISHALYGIFETGHEQFTVELGFEEDFAFPVELFVPHRDELREHRPAWALVGPGLPQPSDEEKSALPRPLPDGAGAFVDLNRVTPRPAFYESHTRRFFWSSGPVALVVRKGDYQFWIWSPERTKGKFGLGFGVEEGGGYLEVFRNWRLYAW